MDNGRSADPLLTTEPDVIDLRSDTVTQPGAEMLRKMTSAPTGDDVYGDDPTVNALQEKAAAMSGKQAALFFPSGTQANLVALLSHCQRGDEYIAGQHAHNYRYEAGGAAVLGSIQPQPVMENADGTLPLDIVREVIKPRDIHFARTRLISIENTHHGKVLPSDWLADVFAFSRQHHLALHTDGARIFNAAVASGQPLDALSRYCDTLSICLSKGLGAPVGSLLCGSHDFIEEACRWRKMTGGGMRQAGILAAAGIYALDNNVARLAEDHENARWLAAELAELGIEVSRRQTNMIFIRLPETQITPLQQWMDARGIRISFGYGTRLVTHLDTPRPALQKVVDAWKAFLQQ